MTFGPTESDHTTTTQEDAQNAALGNATALNPAIARDDALQTVSKAATGNLSVANCTNRVIDNFGQTEANTQTLPTAAAGLSFLAIISAAGVGAFNVKAGASDKIYLDGTGLDDGDKVSLATPAVGNCAGFFTFQTGASAWDWYCNTIAGVWTDGGA